MAKAIGVIKQVKKEVTKEELIQLFPEKKGTITQDTVDLINMANMDPEFDGNEFFNQMKTFKNVMLKCQGSFREYINALKFCAYLEAEGDNATEAYKRARANDEFVQLRANAPTDSKEYKALTNQAGRYKKTPMVVEILTQSDMPFHLMYQAGRHIAANKLLQEGLHAEYAKDRINALDKFLVHTKQPEERRIELDVGVKRDSVIDQYEGMINKLVEKQKADIEAGGDLKAITNVDIIEVEDYDG